MGNDAARTLEDLLPGPVPAGIAALDESKRQQLADTLRAARTLQSDELEAATEAGLKHVPALLRGAVRKVIGL